MIEKIVLMKNDYTFHINTKIFKLYLITPQTTNDRLIDYQFKNIDLYYVLYKNK